MPSRLIFTRHVRERMLARCPHVDDKAARCEILGAIRHGRVATERPPEYRWRDHDHTENGAYRFCMNRRRTRCWVLAGRGSTNRRWYVVTVLTPIEAYVREG